MGRAGGELATDNPGHQLLVDLVSINLQRSMLGDFVGLPPSLRVFSRVALCIPHPWHTPSYNIAPSPQYLNCIIKQNLQLRVDVFILRDTMENRK